LAGKYLLEQLRDAVVSGSLRKARRIAEQITIQRPALAKEAIDKTIEAMETVDMKYQLKQCSVTDVIAAASAMREVFKILEPHLEIVKTEVKGRVIIGLLKGNMQGLGKDIVAAALRAAGFQVYDLGEDVPPETFVEKAVQEEADIIAVSITFSDTAKHLKKLMEELENRGLRGKIKVVIGGKGVSEETCREYSIEAYAVDAWDCIKKVEGLLENNF
jgi:methylmalonyl-CoA mutase cobalamin-binding domain/chain